MKTLEVTTMWLEREHTTSHPLSTVLSEDTAIVATLQGIINAGHAIKSFEIVED